MTSEPDRIFEMKIMPLCEPLLQEVGSQFAWTGLTREDARSAGLAGVLKGLRRYDPARGAPTPFLYYYVRCQVQDEAFRTLGFTPSARKKLAAVLKAQQRLELNLGRSPSVEEVASEARVHLDETQVLLGVLDNLSLDAAEDFSLKTSPAVIAALQDRRFAPEGMLNRISRAQAREVFDTSLRASLQSVKFGYSIWQRYMGWGDDGTKPRQEDIAEELGVTREHVNRVYNRLARQSESHEARAGSCGDPSTCWVCRFMQEVEAAGWDLVDLCAVLTEE